MCYIVHSFREIFRRLLLLGESVHAAQIVSQNYIDQGWCTQVDALDLNLVLISTRVDPGFH